MLNTANQYCQSVSQPIVIIKTWLKFLFVAKVIVQHVIAVSQMVAEAPQILKV